VDRHSRPNPGGGGNVGSVAFMHEDDEDDSAPYIDLNLRDGHEDPKRKFLYARQLTHFFEDNPPLPLLPKSGI